MLTGARRAEIAGLRWDEIVTEEMAPRPLCFGQAPHQNQARAITFRCAARRWS